MAELKPCPFCGGEAYLESHDKKMKTIWKEKIPEYATLVGEEVVGNHTVFLLKYGLYMPRCKKCGGAVGALFVKREVAIEAWNRRAGDGDG